MIEKYIMDEIEDNDLKSGANFDDVVYIYKKLYKICCNVSSHANIMSNATFDNDENKFGYLSTSRNTLGKSRDDDEDSVSSNSSAVYKRNDSNKVQKPDPKSEDNNDNNDKSNSLDDLLGLDTLKPSKPTDDFFNFSKKNGADATGGSNNKLGELPPLNNGSNNFQNKFFSTSNSKDFGKKSYDEDYDDDFTK